MQQSNRLWRKGVVAVIAGAVVLTLGACASSSNDAGASASASSGKPLVIGASISLTGDFADSGKAVKRGYELWASEVNAKGGVLGRKVTMKLVDDASSPTQVVSNYQNLINRDKVDLVFGPFSSLLTVPASQVAKRYSYAFLEPAGGGPKVFAQKLNNLFFVQPAPVVKSGDVFADWILSLPADKRPKTAAYTELDDPFAQPIAENIRTRFEAAGIKTVYQQVYPAETQDFSAIMAKVVAANPDVLVGGTQNEDAYAQVKTLVQLKFSPKFMFLSNGANSPLEFPTKVGTQNTAGIMSVRRLVPGFDRGRQRRLHGCLHQGQWRHCRHHRQLQRRGLRLRTAPGGRCRKDRKDRQRHHHHLAAPGRVADGVGQPELGTRRCTFGQLQPHPVAERQARSGLPRSSGKGNACLSQAQLGRVTD